MFVKSLILAILIAFSPVICQPVEYSVKTLSTGTELVRLKIPENSKVWTCFDEGTYKHITQLALNDRLKDSLINLNNYKVDLLDSSLTDCQVKSDILKSNEIILKTQNQVLISALDKTSKDLQNQKIKTLIYSVGSGVVGFSAGAIVVFLGK